MVCSKCGTQNPEGSLICRYCGSSMEGRERSAGVRTLFHDLSRAKEGGAYAMFSIFSALCVSLVLTVLALVQVMIVEGMENKGMGDEMIIIHVSVALWWVLLIFQIVMILMAILKQDLIHVMVGTIGIEGIITILFFSLYIVYFKLIEGPVAVAIIFMVLLILGMLCKFVFLCIHAFSGRDFGHLMFIFSVACAGAVILFGVITMLIGISDMKEFVMLEALGGLGLGFSSYLITEACVAGVGILLYKGRLGTKSKFTVRAVRGNGGVQQMSWQMSGQPGVQAGAPGIQCIAGPGQGQVFPVSGEIVLGSGQGQADVVVPVQGVSRQHCRIRFDVSQNGYYVMDLSVNGTYVNNQRLPSGAYTACARGSIVALSNQGQQYRLL